MFDEVLEEEDALLRDGGGWQFLLGKTVDGQVDLLVLQDVVKFLSCGNWLHEVVTSEDCW